MQELDPNEDEYFGPSGKEQIKHDRNKKKRYQEYNMALELETREAVMDDDKRWRQWTR